MDRSEVAQAALPGARSHRGRRLSVVIPMHNEEAVLAALFERLDAAMADLGVELEIVCVDDGSRDGTFELLTARAATDRRLRILALSRNFGKEAALTAGLSEATGDLVVPFDADLQDPPELIAEFLALWEQGYDVVYGVRADRRSDTRLKRLSATLFYRVFNALSDHPIPASTGDFRLMDRKVVDALMQLPERNRFMKGLFAWVGYRQVGVPYVRPARAAGASSWGYSKLWRFALDGVTSFSTAPLRIWTSVGVVAALLAVLYGLVLIVRVLFIGRDVPGYASMMAVILFGFALQMIAFGVIGEYVGRVYEEVKGRPLYMVRERVGFDS
ncbi:glycosyltransferase [Phenylobacterium hankyongense]|uniref:Glycosyltransferase n=1 Tax=Phenylobacterium hankyongense TaxID=1813876 RepID=A0A328B753_9CAUL|nr:glycosyltransferase family 2 protein [Phenylobacterium hankyongense]RAK60848.1 glycosyltransferase [Phenylobacterium hankyongense]